MMSRLSESSRSKPEDEQIPVDEEEPEVDQLGDDCSLTSGKPAYSGARTPYMVRLKAVKHSRIQNCVSLFLSSSSVPPARFSSPSLISTLQDNCRLKKMRVSVLLNSPSSPADKRAPPSAAARDSLDRRSQPASTRRESYHTHPATVTPGR